MYEVLKMPVTGLPTALTAATKKAYIFLNFKFIMCVINMFTLYFSIK